MTPVPQQPGKTSGLVKSSLTAGTGALLLATLFVPTRDPITHGLVVDWRPSAELAGLVFIAAMVALVRPAFIAGRGTALTLALLVVVAALLNLADAATPSLLGRDLNLYGDLRHLPSLLGLAREWAGLWRVSVAVACSLSALLLVTVGVYWIWCKMLVALTDRRVAIGTAGLLGAAVGVTGLAPAGHRPLATGFGGDILRHAVAFDLGWHAAEAGGRLAAALATQAPPRSALAGLKGRDVYLVYIESYGTTVFDTPEFASALQEPLAQFAARLRASGYAIASNRLVSPTFGGGSWLAHATIASGVRLDDPVLYAQLLRSGRKLLPSYFKEAGWRAIAVMPGIKVPSAEGRAWDFDREVFAAELGYHGPSFGWFVIPDQFTLDRAAAMRSTLGSQPPVFTQIVLVSSHAPFSPVPPYLADWSDCGAFATVPAGAWEEVYRQPELGTLGPNYLKSLKYDFAVLGDWLARYVSGDALVILLGDHQPPAVVGGELRQWTVPIHVLSRDPDLVAPFVAAGYVAGLVPSREPPHPGMEKFLPWFLAAFDRSG